MSFNPKGDLLATGGMSAESHGTVIFWNAKTATSEPPLDASESNVLSLAFSLDGSLLVTGGENRRGIGDVILWDVGRLGSLLARHSQSETGRSHASGVRLMATSSPSSSLPQGGAVFRSMT